MNGSAPSINNPEFLGAANDGLILATIALGRPGTAMRAFGKHEGGVADLEGVGAVKRMHIAEALSYRRPAVAR